MVKNFIQKLKERVALKKTQEMQMVEQAILQKVQTLSKNKKKASFKDFVSSLNSYTALKKTTEEKKIRKQTIKYNQDQIKYQVNVSSITKFQSEPLQDLDYSGEKLIQMVRNERSKKNRIKTFISKDLMIDFNLDKSPLNTKKVKKSNKNKIQKDQLAKISPKSSNLQQMILMNALKSQNEDKTEKYSHKPELSMIQSENNEEFSDLNSELFSNSQKNAKNKTNSLCESFISSQSNISSSQALHKSPKNDINRYSPDLLYENISQKWRSPLIKKEKRQRLDIQLNRARDNFPSLNIIQNYKRENDQQQQVILNQLKQQLPKFSKRQSIAIYQNKPTIQLDDNSGFDNFSLHGEQLNEKSINVLKMKSRVKRTNKKLKDQQSSLPSSKRIARSVKISSRKSKKGRRYFNEQLKKLNVEDRHAETVRWMKSIQRSKMLGDNDVRGVVQGGILQFLMKENDPILFLEFMRDIPKAYLSNLMEEFRVTYFETQHKIDKEKNIFSEGRIKRKFKIKQTLCKSSDKSDEDQLDYNKFNSFISNPHKNKSQKKSKNIHK